MSAWPLRSGAPLQVQGPGLLSGAPGTRRHPSRSRARAAGGVPSPCHLPAPRQASHTEALAHVLRVPLPLPPCTRDSMWPRRTLLLRSEPRTTGHQIGAEGPPSLQDDGQAAWHPFKATLPPLPPPPSGPHGSLPPRGSLPAQNAAGEGLNLTPSESLPDLQPLPASGPGLCSLSNKTPEREGVETEPGSAASLPSCRDLCSPHHSPPTPVSPPRILPRSPSPCPAASSPRGSSQASALWALEVTFLALVAQATPLLFFSLRRTQAAAQQSAVGDVLPRRAATRPRSHCWETSEPTTCGPSARCPSQVRKPRLGDAVSWPGAA